MEGNENSEWPLHYLMASYNRLSEALRSLTTIRDQEELQRMTDTLIYGKQLTVSYSGLLLNMDMFPQVLTLSRRTHMWARHPSLDCHLVSSHA